MVWRRADRALAFALAAIGLNAWPARAAGSFADAKAAYDRGAAAYDAGDFARAAGEFARADAIAPNDTALAVGLDAALRAGEAVLGMTMAERAFARHAGGEAEAHARAAEEAFRARTGRVRVLCRDGSSCSARLDAAPIDIGESRWVTVGVHAVELEVDARAEAHAVRVEAGAAVEVSPDPPASPTPLAPPPEAPAPRPEPARERERGGVSPVWFWTGVGLTAAVSGVTLASALDTRKKHEDFLVSPTEALARDGASAQTRTNVLFAASLVAVAATAVVGVLFVRWTGAPQAARLLAEPIRF